MEQKFYNFQTNNWEPLSPTTAQLPYAVEKYEDLKESHLRLLAELSAALEENQHLRSTLQSWAVERAIEQAVQFGTTT